MATISEALAIAVQHHQGGRLRAAEQIYRQILAVEPNQADAWHFLGVIAHQGGKPDEATVCYRHALELQPDYAEAHNNLGMVLRAQGKLDEALVCYRRALELRPDYAQAHNSLGNALRNQGKLDEAAACYRRAVELKPDYAEAHNNLGVACREQGKADEAATSCRRAIELKPDYSEAHNNLGNAMEDLGNLDEAVACYRRALEVRPDYARAHSNLGVALQEQGRLDEAIACYRRALELQPDRAELHSNLLYVQLFHPGYDAHALYEEHRRWNARHAAHLAEHIPPYHNDRSPDRRLRIGYVSPDFRDHVVGRNLLPLFREHDHRQFEIFCYADVPCPDELTDRFRGYADTWRDTAALSDAQFAERIRADGVDILVDLTLHMARNRLLVFARKPSPVQVTFAGYPGTTGLTTMDYRITDPYLDPPGLFDDCCSEQAVRLPDSFWCYDPLDSQAAVSALPAAEKGYVSFGCLNNFRKVNPLVLKLWARVLKSVAGSRLTMLAGTGTHRQGTLDLLAEEGVTADRVTFVGQQPRPQYLEYYHDLDIGLDTVPYNGHTTSLDTLWMGVPVVTLVGPTVVGRAGLGQLMNLGLPELVADHDHGYMVPDMVPGPEQYVRIAVELAGDLPRLRGLRATLRGRMQASPLMDAPRFARNIEAAYREMWRRWCS